MRSRSLTCAMLLVLAFAAPAVAQEYSFRVYGAAEGLQNLVVLSLAQDRVGYIWAGCLGERGDSSCCGRVLDREQLASGLVGRSTDEGT